MYMSVPLDVSRSSLDVDVAPASRWLCRRGDRRVENRRTEDVAAVRNLMPHASSTLYALPLYATQQTQKYQ